MTYRHSSENKTDKNCNVIAENILYYYYIRNLEICRNYKILNL